VLRLRGYDFALPYIDHPDEPNFALSALWCAANCSLPKP